MFEKKPKKNKKNDMYGTDRTNNKAEICLVSRTE